VTKPWKIACRILTRLDTTLDASGSADGAELLVYAFGEFQVDPANQLLLRNGAPIALTPKVFQTLLLLIERPGQLVTKDEFVRRLWPDTFVEDAALAENISRLRRALGDTRVPALIVTVPKRGYRFAPQVTVTKPNAEPDADEARATARRRRHSLMIAALLVCGVIVGSALVAGVWWRDGSESPIGSIAVLPFENLGHDPDQEFLADGITEELITNLAKIGGLRVTSRTSVMRFKGAHPSLAEIANSLNVDALVEGTVLRSGNRIRVTAHAVRVGPEKNLWAEEYDRPITDVMTLEAQVAREIARSVHVTVTATDRERLVTARRTAPAAYEAFLKGRYYWSQRTEEATAKAIAQFQLAVQTDPEYAPTFSGLADSYISQALSEALQEIKAPQDAFPLAREAALRALALDPLSAEAHASLGHIHFQYDRDWPASEREFLRAIELNPNYANAHHWYALSLLWRQRTKEAISEIDRARDQDPLSLVINANRAFILACAGRNDLAIEQARKALDLDEHFAYGHYRLGQIYLLAGRPSDAVPELERAIALGGHTPRAIAELGLAWASSGRPRETERSLDELTTLSARRYVPAFDFALVHAALGHREQAIRGLFQAYEEHSPSLSTLHVSPAFKTLRTDARFVDLVRRVGLPN
jgi:TolB-like protein/DNA-binding winged helix-turn-helix (wHTH) protein/Flp pilus assembly protein TadD